MLVIGATPMRGISRRGKSCASTCITLPSPGVMRMAKAPVTLALSISACSVMAAASGAGRSIQKAVKPGNSSPEGSAVPSARARAEMP